MHVLFYVCVFKDSANKMVVFKEAFKETVSSVPLTAGGDVIQSCKLCWIRFKARSHQAQ